MSHIIKIGEQYLQSTEPYKTTINIEEAMIFPNIFVATAAKWTYCEHEDIVQERDK